MRAHTHTHTTTLKAKDVRRQYMYIFNDLMKKRKKSQCNIIVHAESFLSLDFLSFFSSLSLSSINQREKMKKKKRKINENKLSFNRHRKLYL